MIIFRADGNETIGSGHIMRCLSIADTARRIGETCIFVTAGEEFLPIISSHRHECIILNTKYTEMNIELDKFLFIIHTYHPSLLFVDSYFVSSDYLQKLYDAMKKCRGKLIYIDDMLAFPYPCDVLLNYNIYGSDKREEYNSLYIKGNISKPQFLLGTMYAPLREEFQNLPERIIKREAKNILISTGGADPEHLTIEIVREVKRYRDSCIFAFIIGALNQDKKIIHDMSRNESHIVLYDNVTQMAKLMSYCDVAISAAGSTLYELCATQTPTITYILADNQRLGAESFSRKRIMECAGDIRDMGINNLSKYLVKCAVELAHNYEKRMEISENMKTVVDGRGAENILFFCNNLL